MWPRHQSYRQKVTGKIQGWLHRLQIREQTPPNSRVQVRFETLRFSNLFRALENLFVLRRSRALGNRSLYNKKRQSKAAIHPLDQFQRE